MRNKQDAEDVASEAVIKLFNYAQNPNFAVVKDAGAFVYTLVRNTALDFLRKRKPAVELDDGLDKLVIYNAMRGLSERDFKIAEMFYYYDCKIKTIAEATDLTVSAVKYHLGEIRKKLYEILKKD